MSSIAPRTPARGLRAHPSSPGKSVFAPNLYTRGTAQNRFKSNVAALLILFGVKIFMPQVIDACLNMVGLTASIWGARLGEKVVSFVEISIPLLFLWNAVEAAYHITWPATYPTSPPTPGPFSTPLSPAQRRLRGLTPKPARPPTFPPLTLPPSPLRSPTHPPLDQPTDSFFQTSPTKSMMAVERNPFLAPATPFRSQAGSSTNPFLNSALRSASRDQVSMFGDSSPAAAFGGRHSIGPGKALDSSMVQSLVSELDR